MCWELQLFCWSTLALAPISKRLFGNLLRKGRGKCSYFLCSIQGQSSVCCLMEPTHMLPVLSPLPALPQPLSFVCLISPCQRNSAWTSRAPPPSGPNSAKTAPRPWSLTLAAPLQFAKHWSWGVGMFVHFLGWADQNQCSGKQ